MPAGRDRSEYSLIIVDDEHIIRHGLAEFTDWKSLGYSVAASFEDGREAIDYLEHHRIDVVLTDIKMADVSGIDLAKYVHENAPETKVVILSGYREFEDAKAAIEYGVRHYLLKPVDIALLHSVFRQLADQLESERRISEKDRSQKDYKEEIMKVFQEHFFLELMTGLECDSDRIRDQFKYTGLPIDPECAPCILFHIENQCVEEPTGAKGLKRFNAPGETAQEFLSSRLPGLICCPVNIDEENSMLICFPQNNPLTVNRMDEEADKLGNDLGGHLHDIFGEKVNVRDTRYFESFLTMPKLRVPIFHVRAEPPSTRLSSMEGVTDRKSIRVWLEELLTVTHSGDDRRIDTVLDELFSAVSGMSVWAVGRLLVELFAGLTFRLEDTGADLGQQAGMWFAYPLLLEMSQITEMKQFCAEALKTMTLDLESRRKNVRAIVIDRARSYIDSHFHENLSLHDVSGHVYLSPIYFSHVFKEETGITFIDYLTRVRMDKAVSMMKERRHRICEICGKVGYGNGKYFSKRFRQHFGVSPSEYYRRITRDE